MKTYQIPDITGRKKVIACMEYLVRQINNEDILPLWLQCGVADGDIEYGNLDPNSVPDYYTEDATFKDLMTVFLKSMHLAYKDGGLYSDNIVSGDISK